MEPTFPSEIRELRDETARLRSALQNIATTLDSASDDSLRAALRMVKGMAVTALQAPQTPRPVSSSGKASPANAGGRPITEPALPVFDPTPAPGRPNTPGDEMVVIPPNQEPAKKITEPSVKHLRDSDL